MKQIAREETAEAGTIDEVVLNGRSVGLTGAARSDLDHIRPGVRGAVVGANTLEVHDVAGNVTTIEFTLIRGS
ncbi:hypothetical protein ABZ863_05130 [Saccharomonospora sp. NPDC046836]|uniref:hypothetical protein n=1 Tax=Saccharomonospora sp. NPDC046836 TaxID=3156921 RepID=UPI0033F340EC